MTQIKERKFVWDLKSKHNLTKLQKEILKDFFKGGPNTRSDLNKKLGKNKRGESYNENIDRLVHVKLLQPEERIKEASRLKHSDTSFIKDAKLRKAVKDAFRKKDYGRPRQFSKAQWEKALVHYRQVNYNERFEGKVGETLYYLTVWGVVTHLKNEGKISKHSKIFFGGNPDLESKSKVTKKDLEFVLRHFGHYFHLITRKWHYLCKKNYSKVVYEQLFQALLLSSYYYEVLNADFAKLEKSALDDIQMNFFIPRILLPEYANKWMTSLVKDNEIYDYLHSCFEDLQQNYKTNQKIITEYKDTLESFREAKKPKKSKFCFKEDFTVKAPRNRRMHLGANYYLSRGYWSYHLSNFLNVLDSGQFAYDSPVGVEHPWYHKKRGKNPVYVGRIRGLFEKPPKKKSSKKI